MKSPRSRSRGIATLVVGAVVVTGVAFGGVAAFASSSSKHSSTQVHKAKGTVNVLYAGSLVDVMTKSFGPAFTKATGYTFDGVPGGSTALANQIKGGLATADVFVSASATSDKALEGTANGNWVKWYASLGTSPLVIGYDSSSKYAPLFKTESWWKVLSTSGILIGRTDPALDPKGALTITLVNDEASKLHDPGLATTILGATENPSQVFPEETLVARLTSGQLDAGFFYLLEAKAAHFSTVSTGIPLSASFTVTIPRGGKNLAGAEAFVKYLYSNAGKKILDASGLQVGKPKISGAEKAVPKGLRGVIG
jgi:molybdate/tungstate transport system substrate-binding protein